MKIKLSFILVFFAMASKIHGNVISEMSDNEGKMVLLSGECRSTLKMYANNMKNSTDDDIWALKMWDASSKFPVGLLSYNFGELGNFEQCVNTKSVSDNIKGKYCLGNIFIKNNSHLISKNDAAYQQYQMNLPKILSVLSTADNKITFPTWAICIPSNCSDDDALNILRGIQVSSIYVVHVRCQTIEDVNPQLTTGAIISIIFLSVIVFIMVLSTGYDLYCRSKEGDPSHLALIAFSVYTHGEKLFHMKNNQEELSFLNGMRFMSLVWVVVNHTRQMYDLGHVFNSKYFIKLKHNSFTTILQSVTCAISTFLMIGGVLVSYVFFKQKRNEEKFNIFKHYFHRYIRLTPSLAAIVLFQATLSRYMGSGPEWGLQKIEFEIPCQKYWWSTLLYIQNYVNVNEMCVPVSWYLNVDMQLYLISPLILFLLNKRPTTAIALLVLATLASICVGFWIAVDDQLLANIFDQPIDLFQKYLHDFYHRTHCRAAPWLMGTILGYLLTRDTAKSMKIPKVLSSLAWIFSFVVMTICIFGGSTFFKRSNHDIGNAFFLAFQSPAWSLCIGWIIWACATSRGGIINSILSCPIFQFLNQFTLSIYILHRSILQMMVFSQRISFYYTVFNVVYNFCGIFSITFGVSIIWVLTFERPLLVLEKIIFKNK